MLRRNIYRTFTEHRIAGAFETVSIINIKPLLCFQVFVGDG